MIYVSTDGRIFYAEEFLVEPKSHFAEVEELPEIPYIEGKAGRMIGIPETNEIVFLYDDVVSEEILKSERYHALAAQYIGEKYPNKDVEIALINNFNTGLAEYVAEYADYQAFRMDCKASARVVVYGEG